MKGLPAFRSRLALLAVILAGAAVLGVIGALMIDTSSNDNQRGTEQPAGVRDVKEILVAGLTEPDQTTRRQPLLKTKAEYFADEPLAMRVEFAAAATNPISFTVRLLAPGNVTVPLAPAAVSLTPAAPVFCCWRISEPGTYELQVFSSRSLLTTARLVITPNFASQEQPQIKLF